MATTSTPSVPTGGQPIEINSVSEWNNILRHAYAHRQTVIVDFHAQWCGPCKTIAPLYTNLASQKPFTYFLRVDVDGPGTKAIAAKYSVSAMPTFVAIKRPIEAPDQGKGQVVETLRGADPQGLTRIVNTYASFAYTPSSTLASEDAEKYKNSGNDFFRKKEFASAIDEYSKAIDLLPQSGVLFANRALTYLRWIQSCSEGAATIEERNQLRPKLLSDAECSTRLEERWAKAWVRLGEAFIESVCEESMADGVLPDVRDEGRKMGLGAAEEALENAIDLSEGMIKTEAQKLLNDVRKELQKFS